MSTLKVHRIIYGLLALYAIYILYLSLITLFDVIPNEILYGGLYSKYIYNIYLQLTYALGILTAAIFIVISRNVKVFNKKKMLYYTMLGLSSLLPILYVVLYHQIENQMVESSNFFYLVASISTALPISFGLFAIALWIFQKRN